MKTQTLYSIEIGRMSAFAFSNRLVSYSRARKIVKYLRKHGKDAYTTKWLVNV